MKTHSFLILLLLVACVLVATQAPMLPSDTTTATKTVMPSITAESTNPDTFSDCPLPASDGAVGKLRLVYVTEGNLWLLDEGKEPIQMMESGDVEQVMLSPDGSQVVLSRRRDADTVEVWAANSFGWRKLSGDQRISRSIEFISFSDDGQIVAFEDTELDWGELWVADINGASVRRQVSQEDLRAQAEVPITFPVSPEFVTWIPGTHRLTFTPIHGYPPGLGGDAIPFPDPVFSVDADTGEQSVLFPRGEGGYITYSPDGKTMVITDSSHVRVKRAADFREPQTIIHYPTICALDCFIAQPAWMHDSSSFLLDIPSVAMNPDAFLDGYEQPFTIWEFSSDGNSMRMLGEFFRLPGTFSISPDLKRVAYFRRENTRNLHIANVDRSEDILYASDQDWAFHGWTPDSRHFAYQAYQDDTIMYGDICGKGIPLTDVPGAIFIDWLDASRFLILVDMDLYIGIAGGETTRLVEFGASVIYDYVVIPE